MGEGRVKVIGRASHDLVDLPDDLGVQVLMTGGEFPNLVFEFLHRLGSHLDGPGPDVESEKGEALSEGRHLGFLGTQREAEAGQMPEHQVMCLTDLSLGFGQDHKIVGVTHEAEAGVVECPIEAVESDVGEKGGNDTPLRRAQVGGPEDAVLHDSGPEKLFDEKENVTVSDELADAAHNDVVRDVVEEPFDVGVQHVVEA